MKYVKLLAASSALVLAGAANAGEFSSSIAATSDYDFRGISLSATDPALQVSVDWAADNGFYAGAWASNIDYGSDVDGDLELDLYLGLSGETGAGLGWDVGLVYYTYPGSSSSATQSKIDAYPEIYAGVSYGIFEFKQWIADYPGSSDDIGYYTEAGVGFELPAGFTLGLHVGYNYGDFFDGTEYADYSIAVGYTLGNFDLELKYVDNSLSSSDALFTKDDVFNSEGRAIFTVSTSLPW
jgi:uncharacterized protein (TIGR02001 family)